VAELDLERAKGLIGSARDLFEMKDLTGVAGLAYQAFESAVMVLLKIKNGGDKRSHFARRKRAKELMAAYNDTIDELWDIRNLEFYGNARIGEEARKITEEEVKRCLEDVEEIIKEIEGILDDE